MCDCLLNEGCLSIFCCQTGGMDDSSSGTFEAYSFHDLKKKIKDEYGYCRLRLCVRNIIKKIKVQITKSILFLLSEGFRRFIFRQTLKSNSHSLD